MSFIGVLRQLRQLFALVRVKGSDHDITKFYQFFSFEKKYLFLFFLNLRVNIDRNFLYSIRKFFLKMSLKTHCSICIKFVAFSVQYSVTFTFTAYDLYAGFFNRADLFQYLIERFLLSVTRDEHM